MNFSFLEGQYKTWVDAGLTLLHLIWNCDQASSDRMTFLVGIFEWQWLDAPHQSVALEKKQQYPHWLCRGLHPASHVLLCTLEKDCCWIKANSCCRVGGWQVDVKWMLSVLIAFPNSGALSVCISLTVVQCVEQIRSQTLFLKGKELFPHGSPPGWGSRGLVSTDVTLCLSHTKGKRCWQLGSFSAIKKG